MRLGVKSQNKCIDVIRVSDYHGNRELDLQRKLIGFNLEVSALLTLFGTGLKIYVKWRRGWGGYFSIQNIIK